MRARKGKKPASRSIRYLLSADQRLQKLSLKKISERVKRAAAPRRPRRSKKAEPASRAPRWQADRTYVWLAVVAAICVTTAAALTMARQAAQTPVPTSTAESSQLGSIAQSRPALPRTGTPRIQPSGPEVGAAGAVTERRAAATPMAAGPIPMPKRTEVRSRKAIESEPAATAPGTEVGPSADAARTPVGSVPAPEPAGARPVTEKLRAEPVTPVDAREPFSPVTITGCLELDGGTFRLKDTSGDAAPRKRSWKSGFLRKRSASIELVEPAASLALAGYVDQRVAVTGVLSEREMQPRSVRRLAPSCD